jgi:hypothetical protein
MKKINFIKNLMLVFIAISFFSCKNELPQCFIVSPSSGDTFGIGGTVELVINATDGDGAVASVEVIEGTKLVATLNQMPFMYNWETDDQEAGNCTLTVVVTDDEGESTTSTVSINFVDAPTVQTKSVKFISPEEVVLEGEIIDYAGEIISSGFVADQTDKLFDEITQFEKILYGNASSAGNIEVNSSFQISNNGYYFRVFAEDIYSIGYGDAIECPIVSFSDKFDDNTNEWSEGEEMDEGYNNNANIQDGFYKLFYNREDWSCWYRINTDIDLNTSYVIEATVQFNTNDGNSNSAFGLLFAENIFMKIKDYTYSNSILKNTNKLQVFCFENGSLDDYYFYINGEYAYYYQSYIGGMYSTFGVSVSQGEVWVDDFKISYLESDGTKSASIPLKKNSRNNSCIGTINPL